MSEGKEVKLNKWDSNAVKNALEDVIRKVMTENYTYLERTHLLDGRLFISTIAVAFAMSALLWDYIHPFPQSKPVLIVCVLSYFFLMGVLQLYTWFVEAGAFFVAVDVNPQGEHTYWYFTSKLRRFEEHFTLQIVSKQANVTNQGSVVKSVGTWIDEEGHTAQDKLTNDVMKLHDSLLSAKKKQ